VVWCGIALCGVRFIVGVCVINIVVIVFHLFPRSKMVKGTKSCERIEMFGDDTKSIFDGCF